MAILNTAQSIVDFLKSKGFKPQVGDKFPLFQERTQIYNTLGLNSQLGQFAGTGEQNTALLRMLSEAEKSTGVRINPSNVFDVLKVYRGLTTQPVPQRPQFSNLVNVGGTIYNTQTGKGYASEAELARDLGMSALPPNWHVGIPTSSVPPQPTQPTQPTAISKIQPQEVVSQTPQVSQEVLNQLFRQPISEQELSQLALEKVMGSATFPLQKEAAEAEKEALRLKQARDIEDFIKKISRRGLIYSGEKEKGIQQIEADTLANLLGIDRKFAYLIAQGLESSAQQIAKQAQQGSQMAIESLRSLGYDINPITHKIEPTLAARKAEESALQFQEREQRLKEQQQALEQFREQSLSLRQMQQEATRAYRESLLALREQAAANQQNSRDALELLRRLTYLEKTSVHPGQLVKILSDGTRIPANPSAVEMELLQRNEMIKDYYVPTLLEMLRNIETGAIKGKLNKYTATMPVAQYLRSEDLSMFNALASCFSQQIVYMNSGKQINPEEMKRLQQSLPLAELTTSENRKRLIQFNEITQQSWNRYLRLRGWEIYQPTLNLPSTTNQSPSLSDLNFKF